ncbi:Uma2 family endonuclease [Rivularia sp. UHCC 0363]|uniref:Uma2 family endonuclease n=1 Tax=Rivularia sp. UHCC 0363 TaxID=3110244 RepID=UPI002B209C5E|nr:Uma2 family endonuclease [Rivularia sp. UHCC 0363]MEA5596601.1 Uma2 family endonuclease [Rivularia sp. UHCC 0363]
MLATSINLQLEPGQKVTLQPVSWESFEEILKQLGEFRASRIAYANQILEIMAPLPEHERSKVLLADLVKILLTIQKKSWEPLGSTTFKSHCVARVPRVVASGGSQGMSAGIEPDDCFYIKNYQAVIGKQRIDLNIDPPPDLALETDVTSKTEIDAYEALAVPELWIYAGGKLRINLLQEGKYIESIESEISYIFPNFKIIDIIPRFMQRSFVVGVSQTLEEFEVFVRD